jgi:hypothetical protein
MNAFAFWGIITLAVLFLFLWIGSDLQEEKEITREKYRTGKLININGKTFTVTKKVLANDKCYYVYQGDRRSFSIPCEEKK